MVLSAIGSYSPCMLRVAAHMVPPRSCNDIRLMRQRLNPPACQSSYSLQSSNASCMLRQPLLTRLDNDAKVILLSRSKALIEQTLSWLTLKAVDLTVNVKQNCDLYYPILYAFDQTVRPIREHVKVPHGSRPVGSGIGVPCTLLLPYPAMTQCMREHCCKVSCKLLTVMMQPPCLLCMPDLAVQDSLYPH